jgi:hypothetical protein
MTAAGTIARVDCPICGETFYQHPTPHGLCTYCHEDFVEYPEPPTPTLPGAATRWYADMPELDEPDTAAADLAALTARNIANYARLQRLLDEDVARERDRLTEHDADYEESREWCAHHCPECFGSGLDVVYHSALRDWETGEFVDTEEVQCDACHGTGELTEPAGEPEVLPDADDWLMSYAARDYLAETEE